MKYKIGDIIVCSTNQITGFTIPEIIVGDQYQIISNPEDWSINKSDFPKILFDVKHIKTGRRFSMMSEKIFIPLDIYRDFKLNQILD